MFGRLQAGRFLILFIVVLLGATSNAPAQPASPTIRFQFREPHVATYRIEQEKISKAKSSPWLEAWSDNLENRFEISSRVAVQLHSANDLKNILEGSPLKVVRTIRSNVFILQAPDAIAALHEAERLSNLPQMVVAAHPVMRRPLELHGPYSYKPNDPYASYRNNFFQWHLENRNSDGSVAGADVNVRAAWPLTHGEGIIISIVDDGIEYTHPDLASRAQGMPHFNFLTGTTNGLPNPGDKHATAVAGLAAAELNNSIGVAGVAPGAHLASWKIFDASSAGATDEQLMDMFQYCSNSVAIQNHSWSTEGDFQRGPSMLAAIGIANAIELGRNGLGVVMIRSAGNHRDAGANADDDLYPADPRVIGVGAVNIEGRVASYSNPGACLLVAAPGGENDSVNSLVTTDRQGTNGYNYATYSSDPTLADYCYLGSGFTGTSASAPQVAGIAALILSINPSLTYRDVQQILIHSSRHFDLADPDVITNAAGFRVSHNVGFGIPDAGLAVSLARTWINRPPLTNITFVSTDTFTTNNPAAIPDDGLRLLISNGSTNLMSIPANPDLGLTIDTSTLVLPLVDVGLATGPISQNLTNKGALIQRGFNSFVDKIQYAANAGAAFAVVYNNTGTIERLNMGLTDFLPIPAVFIGKTDGDALHTLLLQTNASAQINLYSTNYTFFVTNTLVCEHVAVRLQTDHPRRADVRITLLSPNGTRSILDRLNNDTASAGPVDWTYYSTHHFYESSYGAWTVCVSDEATGSTGSVRFASLTIEGVPIIDSDHDGLDDNWEMAHFGSLAFGPKDDPDKDGYNNMREQIMETDPNKNEIPFQLDLSRWNESLARLSFPGSSNYTYEVRSGTNVANLSVVTNLSGRFPQTEWFTPYTNTLPQFFSIRALPDP